MSDAPKGAIFISYAREDSVAADRIAEALRSHGLEVWFDQNELRGGEAWDQKIRGQIRTCTLLIPIVSASTQTRGEGYFRREWKLAAERTHDMAAGIPYLVPVVIDETAESAALVPEEFMRVQWTRLPSGRTTPQFAAQVKRLLEAPRGAVRTAPASSRQNPDTAGRMPALPQAEPGRRVPAAAWIGGIAVITIGIAVVYFATRKTEAASGAAAAPRPPAAEKSAPATPALTEKSIAVLPFENLSAEPDSAFFADGIHDEVLTAVQKVSALSKVINRTSVLQYADAKKRDLREIGAKLGVVTVLEGTVRRMGARVRVAVQLTEVQSSRQLWAESYEKELTNVFEIQSAIAQEIATTLKTTLTARERETLGVQRTQNAEAYRLYLQARAMLRDVGTPRPTNRAKVEAAIGLYEQAAAADPGFALPHLELTRCYGWTFWFGFFNPTPENARRAEASAARVRALMPGTPELRLANGYVAYLCRQNWAEALTEVRAAQAGLPNSSDAIRYEAFTLRRLGRIPEAIAALERAGVIDPQDMLGWDSLIESQLFARRYADVIRTTDTMVADGIFSDTAAALRAYARLALDGNVERYRRELRPIRANLARGFLPDLGWRGDLLARDFAAAEAFLDESGGFLSGVNGVVNNPVAQFRAILAFAQGDKARARTHAHEARQHFESRTWIPRQQSIVAAELALANALAGDPAKAKEELKRSHDFQQKLPDALVECGLHYLWAVTHTVLGDRESALAELRIGVGQMGTLQLVPSLADLDPLWDSLKSDPRFAEIMKSAKPL
jgi:TolB-like protein